MLSRVVIRCAAGLAFTALLLWTAGLAIDLTEKARYLPMYLRELHTTKVAPVWHEITSTNPALVADNSIDPVPPPADHPPLKIVCGAHIFRVVYAPHDWMNRRSPPVFASSQMNTQLIILDRQRNAIEVREDVLHELMHVALWEGGGAMMQMLDQEDQYIKPMAPSLRDILVDNPKLVRWLMKAGG